MDSMEERPQETPAEERQETLPPGGQSAGSTGEAAARRRTGFFSGPWRLILVIALSMLALYFVLSLGQGRRGRLINGMLVTLPGGYSCTYVDSRYAVWKPTAKDATTGSVVLDADIRDLKADAYGDVERVLAACDWMTEAELYTNPQGVRMVRGYSMELNGTMQRRYYVESAGSVFLMSMSVDSRYYRPEDCERVLQQTADSIRPEHIPQAGRQ